MINIILCDDNAVLLEHYKKLLNELGKKYKFNISIKTFSSGESLLFNLSENANQADIIYLDIVMNNINGIEVANQLREINCFSEIIFLTSSEEYVFESFDSSPLNYIIKGSHLEKEKFEKIFLSAIEITQKQVKEVICFENRQEKKIIKLHEITHFEICGRKITVYNNNESFEFYETMDGLLNKLPSEIFVRCHRSFIVNIKYIGILTSKMLSLETGEEIPIGITYAKDVKATLSNHLIGNL